MNEGRRKKEEGRCLYLLRKDPNSKREGSYKVGVLNS
jgi:hypothetical protein